MESFKLNNPSLGGEDLRQGLEGVKTECTTDLTTFGQQLVDEGAALLDVTPDFQQVVDVVFNGVNQNTNSILVCIANELTALFPKIKKFDDDINNKITSLTSSS